jgi:transposase-like protein
VKNNGMSSTSPTVLPAAERRGDERRETPRSTAAGNTVAPEPLAATPRPNPEVVADARRRSFTGEYKQRILAELDSAAAQPGAIGALLRREGLYSSLVATWRRERQAGILKGLTPHKRGPKSKRKPLEEDNQKLRRENQRLTEELRKAAIVIDVQKKVGALLGWPLPKADPEEQP